MLFTYLILLSKMGRALENTFVFLGHLATLIPRAAYHSPMTTTVARNEVLEVHEPGFGNGCK